MSLETPVLEAPVLAGKHIRLEPLETRHIEGLAAAGSGDAGDLYRWTFVPQSIEAATQYVNTAMSWRDAGISVPMLPDD